jgi:tetratricopeptide (TPR) repeat protein
MNWSKRWHMIAALFAFGVPILVYIRTLTPTVPFWDSGEFIATSYILGLPHPPGNPVYTMLGRFMSLIPFETVAWRVNFMSALASALAALFTFLITVRTLRRWYLDTSLTPARQLACEVGGLVAAFFVAFSNSFWDSAIEAEVYSLSSFIVVFSIWLAFNWWDHLGETNNDRLLVLIVYVLSISAAVHLGTILVAPGLLVLFMLVRPNYFTTSRFWTSAALLGGFMLFLWYNEFSADVDVPLPLILIVLGGLLVVYTLNRRHLVKNNLFTWWTLALVVGFTVQLFLLVRSQQHPAINEGSPDTFNTWKDYLLRKQYGPTNPFDRRADLWYQINHMYFRYVGMQFTLTRGFGPFGPGSFWVIAVNAIPYALLAFGAWWNWQRDKKTFWFFLTQNLVMGPALIFYLNFTDHEVRERDYFFTNSYHFLAIWMGMGAAGVLDWLARALAPARAPVPAAAPAAGAMAPGASFGGVLPEGASGPASAGVFASERAGLWIGAVALVGISLLPMKAGWFEHDRSRFYIAHDYAYNMLMPLEPGALVMTNGDNDTFPLWYIQEVEHVRKDVRVVNLSLLNTPWYIKQLKDLEPKVPFSFTDAQLWALQPYQDEKTGKVMWVKDQAVADIVKTNNWKRPIYMAVTVPEQLGFEKHMVLEGLVFRVRPTVVGDHSVDAAKTLQNLYRVFRYDGLVDKNRDYDRTVYKDDNAYKLVQNYSAAHVQVAYQLQQTGQNKDAIRVLRDAVKMTPDFPGLLEYLGKSYQDMGDTAEAERVFTQAQERFPNSAEFYFHLGVIHWQKGHREGRADLVERGLGELRRACALDQRYFDWFGGLFSALWLEGRRQEAVDVLRTWARAHPEDAQGAGWLQTYEESLRVLSAPRGAPRRTAAEGR